MKLEPGNHPLVKPTVILRKKSEATVQPSVDTALLYKKIALLTDQRNSLIQAFYSNWRSVEYELNRNLELLTTKG